MIIDMHTHVWEKKHMSKEVLEFRRSRPLLYGRKTKWDINLKDHYEAMKSVDKAVVLALCTKYIHVPNEYVAQYVETDPDRLIGFCSVNPNDKNCIRELVHCVKDLGFKGLKLYPPEQEFMPNDKKHFSLYEEAMTLEIPILWHVAATPMRTTPLRYSNPLSLEDIAMEFSELRMSIAHLGWPWIAETAVLVRKQPNVYVDISGFWGNRPWFLYNSIVTFMEFGVIDKILFGSDYPIATPNEVMDTLQKINVIVKGTNLPRVPGSAIHNIIHKNAEKFLNFWS